MDVVAEVNALCQRLAGLPDLPLPTRRSECEDDEKKEFSVEEKYGELQDYFKTSPKKFLHRYNGLITPKEIACFNEIPRCEEVEYYIREICRRKNMESRTLLDQGFVAQEVKNRRFRALQKMIKDGDYFSEKEMKKRSPVLYEEYIGRFLTVQEKEDKLKEASALEPPPTLVSFFMDVIDRKEEAEAEMDDGGNDEEFDSDSDEEDGPPDISDEEKKYLEEEFRSRMYQNFLDGLDKNFIYKTVDENTEYDDLEQLGRDEQDAYFDDEEPSSNTSGDVSTTKKEADSEDELDEYMKTVEMMVTDESQTAVT